MAVCMTVGCKGKPKQNETLCGKCKKNSASNEDNGHSDQLVQPSMVVNEVLMYAEYHRYTSARDNIARVLACHFTIEDLNMAKGVLMDKYGDIVNAEEGKIGKIHKIDLRK